MKKTSNSNDEIKITKKTLIIVVVVSLALVVGLCLINFFLLINLDIKEIEAYGNILGPVNALFSGLAFSGIIITILFQNKELSLQRRELVITRDELKRSANEQENSEKALNRQAENLKISAKLTALNTLVNYYTENIITNDAPFKTLEQTEIERKRDRYLKNIEEILEQKESN